MRPLVLSLLLTYAMLGAPSVASARTESALRPEESARLTRGETVTRQQTFERGDHRYVGGLTYTLLDASPTEVAAVFASRTRDEWVSFSRAHDCCLEPVLAPHELPGDPHHAARGVFFPLVGDDGSATTCFRTPLGEGAAGTHTAARPAGADTVVVLREAGLSDADIDALLAAGAAVQRG